MNRSVWLVCAVAVVLTGCASGGKRVAVEDRNGQAATAASPLPAKKNGASASDWRPQTYTIQKGDTLYSIAFNYGLDYHEIAELNGIQNPNVIQAGQEIRLFSAENKPVVAPAEPAKKPAEILTKTQPQAVKLPYSEQALAQVEALNEPRRADGKPAAKTEPPKPAKAPEAVKSETVKPEPAKVVAAPVAPPAPSASASNDGASDEEDAVDWLLPTSGKVIAGFSESANRKGVDIAGKSGQPVYASGDGKVVYSGTGLRGYGKLVIIKHNKTYISAYAHNDQIMVKEREQVKRGQKIAEMGSTDAEQVKLHFEIRKFGKPVDPAKLLSALKP